MVALHGCQAALQAAKLLGSCGFLARHARSLLAERFCLGKLAVSFRRLCLGFGCQAGRLLKILQGMPNLVKAAQYAKPPVIMVCQHVYAILQGNRAGEKIP